MIETCSSVNNSCVGDC